MIQVLVIVLALAAAFLYSMSDFLEQRAAHRAAEQGPLRRMVRDRQWILGWSVGTVAMLVQAAALRLGSVTVVQSLQLTTLLFTLRLSTVGTRMRPGWRDYSGAGLICGGLALFLTVRRGSVTDSVGPDRVRIILLLLLMAAIAVTLTLVGRRLRGSARAVALALAAGVALGCSATLVKLTATDLTVRGVAATAFDWPGYALALATGAGLVLQQIAFASGRLPTATTAMVVVNPLVGSAIAIEGFREGLPASPLRLAGIAVAAVLLIIGVSVLAHSQLVRDEFPQAERVAAAPGAPEPAGRPWVVAPVAPVASAGTAGALPQVCGSGGLPV